MRKKPQLPGLFFEEETHTYRLSTGEILPSITQVLQEAGLLVYHMPPEQSEWYKARGRAVHKAIELKEKLDPASVDERIKPYLEAWNKFEDETGWVTEQTEIPLWHPIYRYAGRIDQVGHAVVFRKNGVPSILEIKTGQGIHPATALQLAAQMELFRANNPSYKGGRNAVLLRGDGTWSMPKPNFYHPGDLNVFLGALGTVQWKRKNKGGV